MRRYFAFLSLLPLVLLFAACGGGAVQGETGNPASVAPASGEASGAASSDQGASAGASAQAAPGETVTIDLVPTGDSDVSGTVTLTEMGQTTHVDVEVDGGGSDEMWLEARVGGCADETFQAMTARVPLQDGKASADVPIPFSAVQQLPHSLVVTPGEEDQDVLACADLGTVTESASPSPSSS